MDNAPCWDDVLSHHTAWKNDVLNAKGPSHGTISYLDAIRGEVKLQADDIVLNDITVGQTGYHCKKESPTCFTIKDIEKMYSLKECDRFEIDNGIVCWQYYRKIAPTAPKIGTISTQINQLTLYRPVTAARWDLGRGTHRQLQAIVDDKTTIQIRNPVYCQLPCWRDVVVRNLGFEECETHQSSDAQKKSRRNFDLTKEKYQKKCYEHDYKAYRQRSQHLKQQGMKVCFGYWQDTKLDNSVQAQVPKLYKLGVSHTLREPTLRWCCLNCDCTNYQDKLDAGCPEELENTRNVVWNRARFDNLEGSNELTSIGNRTVE